MKTNQFVKKTGWILSILLIGAFVLAACQSAPTVVQPTTGKTNPVVTAVTSMTAVPTTAEAELNVVTDPKLGDILVGNKGMTLYMYTKDTADKSNCTGDCLKAWPPLLTQGKPNLGAGVDKTMLGTTNLADGSKIVTYNHMPLYFWAKDTKAGDTTGQGVGKVWYVVSPDGKVVGN